MTRLPCAASPQQLSHASSSSATSVDPFEPYYKAPRRSQVPRFAVWQARQLVISDTVFAVFLLLIYCMYLTRTVPGLCSRGAVETPIPVAQSAYQQQLNHLSWNIFCGKLSDRTSTLRWGWSAVAVHRPTAAPTIAVTAAHNASSAGFSSSIPPTATAVASPAFGSYVLKLAVQVLGVATVPLLAAAAVVIRAVRLMGQVGRV